MPNALIHKPTKTLFLSVKKNKAKTMYATESMAVFPVAECEEWQENFPMLAIAMPPEIGQVVAHDIHVFTVVRRAIDKETGEKRLWYCEVKTRSCGYYPMDDCTLVTDEIIERWVDILCCRKCKEDSDEYRALINLVPEPIRDLCIVRSFNKVLELLPIKEENGWF